ncbi:MAG: hypothetical protein IPL12_12595 [Bacteroidetes bacterium]|nr:hypothetical protein [Bacteroidota bacterium]
MKINKNKRLNFKQVPYEEPLEEINLESDEDYKEQSEINETGAIQIYPHPVSSQSVIEILLSDLQENSRFIILICMEKYYLSMTYYNNLL